MLLKFKIGKIRFYVTDKFLRVRQDRSNATKDERRIFYEEVIKQYRLKKGLKPYGNTCACECCGKTHKCQIHHVLPYNKFPELERDVRNIMMVCNDCHNNIHHNPFMESELIRTKATEMGVDYMNVYNLN